LLLSKKALKLISSRQALEWIAARGRLKWGLGKTTPPHPTLELITSIAFEEDPYNDLILRLNIINDDKQPSEVASD
jgi:hypothetical protein